MESKNIDVEIVISSTAEDQKEVSSELRPEENRGRSGSRSSESSPFMTDSEGDGDGEDFYDAQSDIKNNNGEARKEKITRKSSMIKLTSDLKDKIISQTEWLFSDENLQKDGFLLKHVKRNKDGFVNLKLLSSFKKMRSVCKDYRVICEALKDSKLLQLNEECTKIQRKQPLPDKLFDNAPVRFVVVSNIKTDNPTMDFLSDMFSKNAQIEGVRIIRPGKKAPSDLQSHFAHNPELVNETIAVVEFETAELAEEISLKGLPPSEKFGEPKLSLLHLSAKQISKRTRHISGGSEPRSGSEDVNSGREEEAIQKAQRGKRGDRKKMHKKANESLKSSDYASSSDNDASFSAFSSYRRRYKEAGSPQSSSPQQSPKSVRRSPMNLNSGQNGTTPDSSPGSQRKQFEQKQGKKTTVGKFSRELKLSPLAKDSSPMTSPELKHRRNQNKIIIETSSLPNSPWITRRKLYNKDQNENVVSLNGKLNPFGLVRQPRGPDGTRGFSKPLNQVAIHA